MAEIQRDVKMSSSLREKVKNFPDSPGVYIMKSKTKEILYVGKATSLKGLLGLNAYYDLI